MIASTPQNERNSRLKWYWELLYVLVRRNLKKRYRGSFLGIYWSLLNPIIMTVLYTAVFGTAFAVHYDNSILNYVDIREVSSEGRDRARFVDLASIYR